MGVCGVHSGKTYSMSWGVVLQGGQPHKTPADLHVPGASALAGLGSGGQPFGLPPPAPLGSC